ncbi:rho guanine nucleotide exchange factor 3-like [Tachyglossus aculeatus]|uniref:rho guanine nucleotide exchange factor 3-like n=1 Tax=Tachyglossus aculeatus TaxID=9261 RepID=UPI0018F42161|nr:rho guanine nucleotide exchange factor 3-like [Tachyglossus aculeatus]
MEKSEAIGDEMWPGRAPDPRERADTPAPLPDPTGKKRKQQVTPGEEPRIPQPLEDKGPRHKRVKPVLSSGPPPKGTPLQRLSQSIQRSMSFRPESSRLFGLSRRGSGMGPGPSGPSRRPRGGSCRLWTETFQRPAPEPLCDREVRRQEVIFELTTGEQQLVKDLTLVKKNYYEPMQTLAILSETELQQIFGTLDDLIPLHQDLLSQLQRARQEDGTVSEAGRILLGWLPGLRAYSSYCCNQVAAKVLLDHKKRARPVGNFLRLCQESNFSRRLDLWNFLDLPRSRLVKYPLLLRELLRHTAAEHPDWAPLQEAMTLSQDIVGTINRKTGEAECGYYRQRLVYPDEAQRAPGISRSRLLHCHGELRNNKGQRLHVFLFEEALVVTRLVTHEEQTGFQVYRQPLPLDQLILDDLPDGEARLRTSIRGAFAPGGERAKNAFRVRFREPALGQAHTLQADDAFNKQQWLSCIRQAVDGRPGRAPASPPGPEAADCSLAPLARLSLGSRRAPSPMDVS